MAKTKEKAAPEPKVKPRSSQPRDYVVFRELTFADFVEQVRKGQLDAEHGDVLVLLYLGTTDAKTAKEARRTVAKAKLDEAELKTEQGVPLRAIPKASAMAGRGIAKIRVEPVWED